MPRVIQVVLSGGVGSRLWPLSRRELPKQYLPIFQSRSLLDHCINRNREYVDQTVIVCNEEHYKHCTDILSNEKSVNYLLETDARNTAAAIAFAAFAVGQDDVLFVTPADHMINNGELYQSAIQQAIHLANDDKLVTFGITPTYPETGYGYIEFHQNEVLQFTEKPDEKKAKSFFESGRYLWNSGMFCFKAKKFLSELNTYNPDLFNYSQLAFENREGIKMDIEYSKKIPSVSIDYAVMENSDSVSVVPSDFNWTDLGSFESLYEYLLKQGHPVDENKNMYLTDFETKQQGFFIGLEECILINTKSAILVLQKDRSQEVKNLYNHLKSENLEIL